MKKVLLIIMLLFTSATLMSCNLVNKQDAHIYGVVMSVNLAENDEFYQLVVNCAEYGYMMIPNSDKIYGQFGADYTPNYVIQEGDLLDIWYGDLRDVEILESYPGQFSKEPDRINVSKQNVSLGKVENNMALFELPIGDVSYEHGFDISNKSAGDEICIWSSIIVDFTPSFSKLFTTTLDSITDERISFEIPSEFLKDFLQFYHEDNIVIYETVLSVR